MASYLEPQIHNLLTFFEAVEAPDDLICPFPKRLHNDIAERTDAFFDLKDALPGFYDDAVLPEVEAIFEGVFEEMLEEARRPLVPETEFQTIEASELTVLAPALLPLGPIVFAVKFLPNPAPWAQFPNFTRELNGKKKLIAAREEAASEDLKKFKKRLRDARKALRLEKKKKPQDQDETVIRQSDIINKSNEPRRDQAQKERNLARREAAALNAALKKPDLPAAWKIVLDNLKKSRQRHLNRQRYAECMLEEEKRKPEPDKKVVRKWELERDGADVQGSNVDDVINEVSEELR